MEATHTFHSGTKTLEHFLATTFIVVTHQKRKKFSSFAGKQHRTIDAEQQQTFDAKQYTMEFILNKFLPGH